MARTTHPDPENTAHINARVPKDLKRKIRVQAAELGLSQSEYARRLFRADTEGETSLVEPPEDN